MTARISTGLPICGKLTTDGCGIHFPFTTVRLRKILINIC
jgi:hypothetical protein